MRSGFTIGLALAGLAALGAAQAAFADCHSEHAACLKDASGPLESVACGSLHRSCAAHQARAAQQQDRHKHNNAPAIQNAPHPSGGSHSGRR